MNNLSPQDWRYALHPIDGSLRDIYVLDTTVRDWETVISFLREQEYSMEYERDSEELPFPQEMQPILEERDVAHLLKIGIGEGIQVNCFFSTTSEIEFDIAIEEVDSNAAIDRLCGFIYGVGRCLDRDVILTCESRPDLVMLRYSAADDRLHNENTAEYPDGCE